MPAVRAPLREEFDADGILVGWWSARRWKGGDRDRELFIPRRDEDIKRDRKAIAELFERAKRK